MKYLRVIMLIICTVMLLSQTQSVKASEVKVQDKVELKEEHFQYSFDINIQREEVYAGCEFAVTCPTGYKITKVTYNVNGGTAGPVVARGYTWFSYFSGKNEFSGTITATVHFTIDETVSLKEEAQFELSQMKLYTVTDSGVETDITEPNQMIAVALEKEVAKEVEEVKEQEEPKEVEEVPPKKVEIEITDTPTKTPTIAPKETEREGNKDVEVKQQPTQTIIPTEEISVAPSRVPTVTEKVEENELKEEVVEAEVTLNTISQDQYSKLQSINWILLIALIISLVGNVVLGYLIHKYKKIMEVVKSEKE